ncbi:hypothetical protein LIT32_06735 [Bacillus sp. CMF21]|nr:hypothetical protein LIT32_06735 [Bacillus sp. CMF21]
MSWKLFGKIMILVGAIAMGLNVLFFKSDEYFNLVRGVSFGLFILGIILVPVYSKSKSD